MLKTSPALQQSLSVRTGVSSALNKRFTKKLTQSEDNPFPLAPVEFRKPVVSYTLEDLVKIQDRYNRENESWGVDSDKYAMAELDSLNKMVGQHVMCSSSFNVLGPGLVRDIGWTKYANEQYGMTGHFYEACDAALGYCTAKLANMEVLNRNHVKQVEVKGFGEVNSSALFTFGSQFVQLLKPKVMRRVMTMLGENLNKYPSRLMLIHPFPEDNQGVRWGDTRPYTADELRKPLEQGLGRRVAMHRRGEIRYWHHTYACVVFEADRKIL